MPEKPYGYAIGPGVYPSDEILSAVGRVAVAAATLEVILSTRLPAEDAGRSMPAGDAIKSARREAAALPEPHRERVLTWLKEVADLMRMRNEAVHTWSALWWSPETGHTVVRVHPRSSTRSVDDAQELRQLASEIEASGRAGLALSLDLHPPD